MTIAFGALSGLYEGAFAYPAPLYWEPGGGPNYPCILADEGALVAGATTDQVGIAAGRFGWADPATGKVQNQRTTAQDQIGIVLPVNVNWEMCYWSGRVRYIRSGYQVTVMNGGGFWVRFAGGAFPGDSVYASLLDGTAISGAADNAELTVWKVSSYANPGDLAQISTSAKF